MIFEYYYQNWGKGAASLGTPQSSSKRTSFDSRAASKSNFVSLSDSESFDRTFSLENKTQSGANEDAKTQDLAANIAPDSAALTDNMAHVISDDQNSLKAGARGPSLLEDFLLREKIHHFDHERIPERVVHARPCDASGR